MRHSDALRDIYSALWAGNPQEAKKIISQRKSEIDARIKDLQQESVILDDLLATSTGTIQKAQFGPPQESSKSDTAPKLTPSFKRKRREKVIAVVEQQFRSKQQFTTDEVREVLDSLGIDMMVPENRINTAIGSIITKDKRFELVAPGTYRFKNSKMNFSVQPATNTYHE